MYLVNLTVYGLDLPKSVAIRNVVFTVSCERPPQKILWITKIIFLLTTLVHVKSWMQINQYQHLIIWFHHVQKKIYCIALSRQTKQNLKLNELCLVWVEYFFLYHRTQTLKQRQINPFYPSFQFKYYKDQFTQIQIWFRFVFLVLSFTVTVSPSNRYPMEKKLHYVDFSIFWDIFNSLPERNYKSNRNCCISCFAHFSNFISFKYKNPRHLIGKK